MSLTVKSLRPSLRRISPEYLVKGLPALPMTRMGPPGPSLGGGGGGAAVVNDHVRPVASELPAASLMELSAMTAVVEALDAPTSEVGLRIARRVGASYETLAGTTWSAASLSTT